MKVIKIFSKGEIADYSLVLNEDIIVISFFNTYDIDIISSQKSPVISNPSILKFKNNILLIQKDDIQELKGYRKLKHKILPYSNIFNKEDLINVLKFLEKNNYKNKNIYFQCEYGKSRSLTLAIALHEFLLNKTHILKNDDLIVKNKVIYNIVKSYFKKIKKTSNSIDF